MPIEHRRLARTWLACALLLGFVACEDSAAGLPDDPNDPGPTDTLPPPVRIVGGSTEPRAGDVLRFDVQLADGVDGQVIWRLAIPGADPQTATDAGLLDQEGRFVGYRPGLAWIIATVADLADTLEVTIQDRGIAGTLDFVGRSSIPNEGTTDLWVHGTTAYTGTRSRFFNGETRIGNAMYTWDVTDPSQPVLTSTIRVDAATVNDVKLSADGTLGVMTHERSGDGLNGITLLDLSDPKSPVIITRFTQEMERGVHNVWIEGDFVYAVANNGGGQPRGLRIIDISTPASPVLVATYYAGASFIHDIYVRDGLAFVSHWDVGLVILDVGGGALGGSPQNPVEISRTPLGGNTHNAWYWPETGLVFVGEEDFSKPGVLHVVDASDLAEPVEIASQSFPSVTPHNVWLDEASEVLYVSWYQAGLFVIDVSGELWGDLGRQGRTITRSVYNGGVGCSAAEDDCTLSWAPQVHDGLVYVSDIGSGLWVLRPGF